MSLDRYSAVVGVGDTEVSTQTPPQASLEEPQTVELQGSGRSVLFVGINYAPEETGIAPYTADLAEHLATRGWQVTVLTGMPHYPRWRVSSAYRRRLRAREERNGVKVQRFRHYVPRSQSAARRGLYELTFLAHAATATSLRRPDCVVGVVPSLSGGVIAGLQARRFGVPYGLIIQDLLGPAAAQSGVPGAAAMARPVRAVEGGVARRADGISVITESFRPYLLDAGVDAERITYVPNWTHVSKPSGRASEVRRSFGWGKDVCIALHAGNMGYKQGLENVVAAARLADVERRPVRFVLMGDGSDRKRLESLGRDVGALEFLDPQPAEVFMDILAAADVLVLNERASVRDMSLPGKITSYFSSGRPVVAAVRPDGVTARELARSDGALLIPADEPATLLDGISQLVGNQSHSEALVAAATAYAQRHLERFTLLERAEGFVAGLTDGQRRSRSAGTMVSREC